MKIIRDQIASPKRFPLEKLVDAVLLEDGCEECNVTRFGGRGRQVWEIESKLDEGQNIRLSVHGVAELSREPEAVIDTLRCVSGDLIFGISDSTFMFVQAKDKAIEERIASCFELVEDMPDAKLD